MERMKKDDAIRQIRDLIRQIPNLETAGRASSEHVRWVFNSRNTLASIFGKKSNYYLSFAGLSWKQTGGFVIQAFDIQSAIEAEHDRAYLQCLEIAEGIFLSAIDELEKTTNMDDLYTDKMEEQSNQLIVLLNIVETKLRKMFRAEPRNEKDVQDQVENLLIVSDFQYSREKEHIIYSSKTYIPDFILSDLNMSLEIKICDRSSREKEIISEMNDDILAYKKKFKNIMFLIYDVGQIRDIDTFKDSFSRHNNVIVIVVKH